MELDLENGLITGSHGSLAIRADDEVARKLLMLVEGECNGLGARAAAAKCGYTRQRYYQVRDCFLEGGSVALASEKRGPKTNSRRTPAVEREIIRLLFLDPEASAAVIAQKLAQRDIVISIRSVKRVIDEYGLEKKTLSRSGQTSARDHGSAAHEADPAPRTV